MFSTYFALIFLFFIFLFINKCKYTKNKLKTIDNKIQQYYFPEDNIYDNKDRYT